MTVRYWSRLRRMIEGCKLFTSAECRAHAEEKLARAEHDNQHRGRLIAAVEARLFLASQLRRVEATMAPKRRSKRRPKRTTAWWTEASAKGRHSWQLHCLPLRF